MTALKVEIKITDRVYSRTIPTLWAFSKNGHGPSWLFTQARPQQKVKELSVLHRLSYNIADAEGISVNGTQTIPAGHYFC